MSLIAFSSTSASYCCKIHRCGVSVEHLSRLARAPTGVRVRGVRRVRSSVVLARSNILAGTPQLKQIEALTCAVTR